MLQKMSQWVVFVKKNSCNQFYSKAETLFDPLVIVGFSLQGRKAGPSLAQKTSAQSRKSHGPHM